MKLEDKLFQPEHMACPHAIWRQMRDTCPIPTVMMPHTGAEAYLITRKSDIEFVASHPELFSGEIDESVQRGGSDFGPDFADIFADGGYTPVHTVATSDPPRAQKYRKIILEALSPKRINARRAELQSIIDRLVAALPDDGSIFDFRTKYAVPLPILAITATLGLPESDFDFIYNVSCDYLQLVDPTTPLAIARECAKSLVATQKYLAPLVEDYRRRPAENFLSFLANARDDNANLLSIEEVLSMTVITLIAGNETSRNSIATAAYELARRKDLWSLIKNDPSKVARFAEEMVRYGTPATVTARQVKQDTELAGTKMKKGAPVYIMWGSGSHDESFFEAPEEIRLDRPNGRNHSSFGFGIHHCAGIHLARAELELSIQTWIRDFDSINLAVPLDKIHYEPVWYIRALHDLPVTITRAGGS